MWRKKRKWRLKTAMKRKSPLLNPASLSFCCLLLLCCLLTQDSPVAPSVGAASPPKKLKPTDRYALIFGTVWGPDDHPVYGVKVMIRRVGHKKPKWELTFDPGGEFAQRVPPGKADYEVWADLKGLKTKQGVQLHLPQN